MIIVLENVIKVKNMLLVNIYYADCFTLCVYLR